MPLFKIIFCEEKTVFCSVEVSIEADTIEQAGDLVEQQYSRGELDTRLEEAEPDTQRCETHVGYYEGETFVRVY